MLLSPIFVQVSRQSEESTHQLDEAIENSYRNVAGQRWGCKNSTLAGMEGGKERIDRGTRAAAHPNKPRNGTRYDARTR